MTDLSFNLVGTDERWNFSRSEVQVGRGPSCDLVLPSDQFPMVGREHLIVRLIGSQWWVEDLKSQNGTYLRGNRVDKALISPGDVLRLGADGPELRVEFVPPPEGMPTRVPHTEVQVGPTKPGAAVSVTSVAAPVDRPEVVRLSRDLSKGEETMIEQKINALRNLVVALLVLVLVLGGLLFRQIDQNHQAIKDLDTKASDAVKLFQPKLDERLNQFEMSLNTIENSMKDVDHKIQTHMSSIEKSMNGMDQRILKAEDHFINRLDQEMPTMVEHVIQKEMGKAKEKVQSSKPQ